MKYEYEKRKLITEKIEIEFSFPFYMARHRRYTYAKFNLNYYDIVPGIPPGSIRSVDVTIAEYGFSITPKIEKRSFHVSNNLLPSEFITFLGEYEHTVTTEEFEKHFNETLEQIKL